MHLSDDELLEIDGVEAEVLDAAPVLAEQLPPPVRQQRSALPVVAQAAAVAATGFAAGAVVAVAVSAARNRRTAVRPARRPVVLGPHVTTRTFLVDVHLLTPRD